MGVLSVFTHISNPEIQRKRKRPPRGSGSRRAAAPGATAGPAHPAPRAAARPPLCGRPPASWSRVSGLLTSVLVLPTGHQGLRHLCPWSGHRPAGVPLTGPAFQSNPQRRLPPRREAGERDRGGQALAAGHRAAEPVREVDPAAPVREVDPQQRVSWRGRQGRGRRHREGGLPLTFHCVLGSPATCR